MSIIEKIKKVWHTPEVRHLQEEVKETAGDIVHQFKELAVQAVEKSKDVAEDVSDRIKGVVDYATFSQIEVRVGTIVSVQTIEKSDKLLLLMVDVGEETPRQIVSGIAPHFKDPQSLVDRQAMFVTNLEPRTIFGHESQGMIFAVNDKDNFSILEPDTFITPGTQAR